MQESNGVKTPLERRFSEYSRFLEDHPPAPQLTFVLVQMLQAAVDVTIVGESRQREEHQAA